MYESAPNRCPPENEVWSKVIFLLACVILFTGGGGLCLWESLSRGSLSKGVSVQGGQCQGDTPVQRSPHTVKSGWYASYWNAFLLKKYIVMNTLPIIRRTWLYIFTPTSSSTLHSQWQPTFKNDFKVKAYLLLFSHVSYVNIIRLDWIDNAIFFCS